MKTYCQCCGRQVVSYKQSDDKIVGGGNPTMMVGGIACHECAEDLDDNGLFPEEKAEVAE